VVEGIFVGLFVSRPCKVSISNDVLVHTIEDRYKPIRFVGGVPQLLNTGVYRVDQYVTVSFESPWHGESFVESFGESFARVSKDHAPDAPDALTALYGRERIQAFFVPRARNYPF
jgi:hypothetical protein